MKGKAFHRWRAELTKHLSISNDEDFLSLIFAHNALQQGDHQTASLLFGKSISSELSVIPFDDPRRLYEWELETLVNEYLTTNGSYKWVYASCRRLNCRNPNALAFVVRILREFENEEFSHLGHDIRYELRRVINRQFEWQRGFFNKALLYRTAYLFDGPECRKYLEGTIGLTLDELSFAAFSLFAVFQGNLRIDRNLPTEQVGLNHRTRDLAFEHFRP